MRVEPELHEALRSAAAAGGLSLNEYCRRKLGAPERGGVEGWALVVRRAQEVLGAAMLGVVVYGSFARGEPAAGSDLDVLVVVAEHVGIRRELYRRWDEGPALAWAGHRVEPHFVHLPEPVARITGTWAEVAVEGIVLWERDLVVSKVLVALRRRIAAGELSRRWAHGQPYWVEAA